MYDISEHCQTWPYKNKSYDAYEEIIPNMYIETNQNSLCRKLLENIPILLKPNLGQEPLVTVQVIGAKFVADHVRACSGG